MSTIKDRQWFKAPDYFVKYIQESEDYSKEASSILEMSYSYYREADPKELKQAFDQQTRGEQEQVKTLLQKADVCKNLAWTQFRYNNLDIAEKIQELQYDPDKQVIKVKKPVIDQILEGLRSVMAKIGQ